MDYLKYYFLEDYLREVKRNFQKRGYLTPEEFFCIVIWKSNRAKTTIKRKLSKWGKLDEVIEELTQDIYKTKGKLKLKVLRDKWRFNLPMAAAILTVLYPREFTVYDVRVRTQLGLKESSNINKYFKEFLPLVRETGVGNSLRDKDRYLWGKSFYEDLIKFLNVADKRSKK